MEVAEHMTWKMPSETAPQERVWMAFPPAGTLAGETPAEIDEARRAWSSVANAVVEFEPVTMVVDPADRSVVADYLSAQITVVEAPLDDAWMRDIGPTFVVDDEGRLGAVDWTFNGWGQQEWAVWGKDQNIGRFVAEAAGATLVPAHIVNEGGAIHVDGAGTVFLTESVQLDPLRNPGATRETIEQEMARTIGANNPIWFERGLYRDRLRFGTKGHIDMVATIPSAGVALVHDQQDPSHPDAGMLAEVSRVLESARTPGGGEWEIRAIPAPTVLRDDEDFIDYNYVNHLVVNGGVIACAFDDERDDAARQILREVYPGRDVVSVDARAIFARGGGIHCITQHQPGVARSE
jgi:agmatine deiminase